VKLHVDWNAITALASVISMVAFVLTALYVRAELKHLDKDRYLSVTNQLYATWSSQEFMEAQLWLLHRLDSMTWEQFVEAHRGDFGEAAFPRVGSFYDRVGTLVRLGLIQEEEILSTVGAYAIAVWQKLEPLVREARRIENSVLFDDFERLLPACYECYVPALGEGAQVIPFSIHQPSSGGASTRPAPGHAMPVPPAPARKAAPPSRHGHPAGPRISQKELKRKLDRGEKITVLDVRGVEQVARDPRRLPNSLYIPPSDIKTRYGELPKDHELVVYCA